MFLSERVRARRCCKTLCGSVHGVPGMGSKATEALLEFGVRLSCSDENHSCDASSPELSCDKAFVDVAWSCRRHVVEFARCDHLDRVRDTLSDGSSSGREYYRILGRLRWWGFDLCHLWPPRSSKAICQCQRSGSTVVGLHERGVPASICQQRASFADVGARLGPNVL